MTDRKKKYPLAGVNAVWTGSIGSASALMDALGQAGAIVEHLPLIEVVPPKNSKEEKEALRNIDDFSWIVFTSINATRAIEGRQKPKSRIAAVGPSTALKLEALGWHADLVPSEHDAEGMASELIGAVKKGERVLFVRGDKAQRLLPEQLSAAGIAVKELEVYSSKPVSPKRAGEILERIKQVADLIIVGSPMGAKALAKAAVPGSLNEIRQGLKWMCLGRATADALRSLGLGNTPFPRKITPEELVRTAIDVMDNCATFPKDSDMFFK